MFLKFNDFVKLFEGGNIFKGKTDKIPKGYIQPTLIEYYKELSRLFPNHKNTWKMFVPVGSVGKKDYSGDIDLAIDITAFFPDKDVDEKDLKSWGIDLAEFQKDYEGMKKRARTATDSSLRWRAFLKQLGEYINKNSELLYIEIPKTTSGNMFGLFPQYNEEGVAQDIGVQMDWMVGNLDWLLFSYFSDAPIQNVKGLHRTQLMLSMFDFKGYSFNHTDGVKDKVTREVVAHSGNEAKELLTKLYGAKIDDKILQNYVTLQEYLVKNTTDKEYSGILDIYLKILDSTRADIPYDMQDYWIKNQSRLDLKGKFLPEDSALVPYKK